VSLSVGDGWEARLSLGLDERWAWRPRRPLGHIRGGADRSSQAHEVQARNPRPLAFPAHPVAARASARSKERTDELFRSSRGHYGAIGMKIIALLSVGKVDDALC
jgi:hypothetical protein